MHVAHRQHAADHVRGVTVTQANVGTALLRRCFARAYPLSCCCGFAMQFLRLMVMPQQAALCPAVSAGRQYAGDGTCVFANPFATEISGQTCQPTAAQQLCGGMCAVSEHCHGGKFYNHTLSQERVAMRAVSAERSVQPCSQLRQVAKANHAGMHSDNATGMAPSPLSFMKPLICVLCTVHSASNTVYSIGGRNCAGRS